jgi:hypothetical protein
MSRQTELEQLVINESCATDGIVILIRMGQDPGRERMKRLNAALKELDEFLQGQTTMDRRLAYAFWSLAHYVDQELRSWTRAGREWPAELTNEELIELLIYVDNLFEGGLTDEEAE